MNIRSLLEGGQLLLDQILVPIHEVIEHYVRHRRQCPGITDRDFVRLGFMRTLSQVKSGRDFVQQQQEIYQVDIARGSFFDALHSSRRLRFLQEASWQLYLRGRQTQLCQEEDLLAAFPQLAERAVWAVDGHKVEHACHALRDPKGRQVAPNTLYVLCLHSGLLFPLAAVQGDGRYAHEMPVFRQAMPEFLRREWTSAAPTRRPLFLLDPAFIDHTFWEQQRVLERSGVLMITRAKDNLAPRRQIERAFDRQDPINLGVDADWEVTLEGGQRMRLVQYADPETGTCYQFLTTDLELPPGLIAWLYLLRWRIEKLFDTSKNKLEETKAWATGKVAREMQAHFLAITHNLLVLFRGLLHSACDLREEKLVRKRARYLERREQTAHQKGLRVHPFHFRMPQIVQLSLQFIRSLRNYIVRKARVKDALPRIGAMLRAYL